MNALVDGVIRKLASHLTVLPICPKASSPKPILPEAETSLFKGQ